MKNYSSSPMELVSSLWKNRSLIKTLVQRDVAGRYKGTFIGILWSFLNPIFMLAVYTFVFSVVFKARWPNGSGSKSEFALVLFSGLIIFNLFSECIARCPTLIISNASYVKKIVFPLEILPVVTVGAALFHAMISLFAWFIAYLIYAGPPPITSLLLPAIILPLIFFTVGIGWIISSLGVYIRDTPQFVSMIMTVIMFLSPIFYSAQALPDRFRNFLYFNPLTPAIEQTRDLLMWGKWPNLQIYFVFLFASTCMAFLGFAWFQKTRKGFSDVL